MREESYTVPGREEQFYTVTVGEEFYNVTEGEEESYTVTVGEESYTVTVLSEGGTGRGGAGEWLACPTSW